MSCGFIKFNRSAETQELFKDHYAFCLLAIIAYRAKRGDEFSCKGLAKGESLIGDYRSYGMSEKQYRNAKKRLTKYGLAAFKGTNKGTVAMLANYAIFDPNLDAIENVDEDNKGEREVTDLFKTGRTTGDQGATNKNERIKELRINKIHVQNRPPSSLDDRPRINNSGIDKEKLFNEIWNEYPRKEGRKQAFIHFKATVKSYKDYEAILIALTHYKATLSAQQTPAKFIQTGKTWFNNWQDYLNADTVLAAAPECALCGLIDPEIEQEITIYHVNKDRRETIPCPHFKSFTDFEFYLTQNSMIVDPLMASFQKEAYSKYHDWKIAKEKAIA